MTELEDFCTFAEKIRLIEILPKGGNLSSVVPRILGKGRTRAEGLYDEAKPPALIERLQEYGRLNLLDLGRATNRGIPEPITMGQQRVKSSIAEMEKKLASPDDGWGRFAREVLCKIGGERTSGKQGRYLLGPLELCFDKKTMSWSWKLAGAYPLVTKLPNDIEFVCQGHIDASRRMDEVRVCSESFMGALKIAWLIASQRCGSDSVLIRDVASAYVVAAQSKAFWDKPSKQNFADIPEAAFVINLMHSVDDVRKAFELEKAGIHQTKLAGKDKDIAFELPRKDGIGTEPYATIRMRNQLTGSNYGN
ncbi:MAG: hypothetical protein CRU78_11990 [Candidatus Accumulibacter phosphatis]|uniref:Uncharacterized protein n=1 Tax=Candidatus Accumulibacter phosphatis TaxID=327160 RepID=A0A6A7RUD3_9PROT|nr:hypothetical protein [Candidatus Accumulibacter phosphatis]